MICRILAALLLAVASASASVAVPGLLENVAAACHMGVDC